MAKKYNQVDVYEILDENGNPTGEELRYPVNPKTGKSYLTPAEGSSTYVYKTNDPNDEVYANTKDATASIDIDPVGGIITVTGPKWLTSQVVNSESFKKNYSENKALLSAINLYNQDPNSKMEFADGTEKTAAEVIGDYTKNAARYGNAAGWLATEKRKFKDQFGVDMSDEDVMIANNFVDKDDYKGTEPIFIDPKYLNRYNWSSLSSWDENNGTVSADDFFNNVFKISLSDRSLEDFQKEVLNDIAEAWQNNTYDKSDAEKAAEKEEQLGSSEYANDLARKIQLYKIITQNQPDATAAYNAVALAGGVVNGFTYYASQGVRNVSEGLAQATEQVPYLVSLVNEDAGQVVGTYWNFMGPLAPLHMSAFFAGEMMNAIGDFNSDKEFNQVVDDFMGDAQALWDSELAGRYSEQYAQFEALKKDLDERRKHISGWWAAGDFIGYMAYKVAENVVVLNPAGKGVGSAMTTALGSKGFASMAGKVMSENSAAKLLKGMGMIGNITGQAIFETLIDDRQLVDKAINSKEMTPELWNKLCENWIGNAVGEVVLPFVGKTAKNASMWVADRSTIGRYLVGSVYKGVYWASAGKSRIKIFFADLINAGKKLTPDDIAEAILRGELNGQNLSLSKRLALYNTQLEYARLESARNIYKSPIWGKLDESLADSVNASYAWVLGGKDLILATSEAEAKTAIKSGVEALEATEKEVTEKMAELGKVNPKSAFGKGLDEKAAKKWQHMRKQILLRANFENQVDQITAGVRIQLNKMLRSVENDWNACKDAQLSVNRLENKLKLERWEGDGGTILSKKGAEKMSLDTQFGSYDWKIKKVEEAGGDWRKAFYDDGKTRMFKSQKEFEDMAEAAKVQRARLEALNKELGPELKEALEDYHVKLGRLHDSIMNYMGRHGYISDEEYEQYLWLRNSGRWGENGEKYVPTTRLETPEDMALGYRKGNAWLSDENKPMRKMLNDGPKELQPGADAMFGDPAANLYAWIHTQARVAQGQEFGRALHAISTPMRQAAGYDLDGITRYEASYVERGMKDIKGEFEEAFNSARSYTKYSNAIIEAANVDRIYKPAVEVVYEANPKKGAKAIADAKKEAAATDKRIDKLLSVEYASIHGDLVNGASGADIDALLRTSMDPAKIPTFNPDVITAAEFNDWMESIPGAKDLFTGKLSGQKLNITNVRKLAKQDEGLINLLKKNYVTGNLMKESSFKNSKAFKNFLRKQYSDSMMIKKNTTLSSEIKRYNTLVNKAAKLQGVEPKDYSGEFIIAMDNATKTLVDEMTASLGKNKEFEGMVERIMESNSSIKADDAKRYLVLNELTKKSSAELVRPLEAFKPETGSSVGKGLARKAKGDVGSKYYEEATDIIEKALKNNIDKAYSDIYNELKPKVSSDVLDNETYFKKIEEQMNDIEEKYLFEEGEKITGQLNQAQRRRIVELVGPDGKLRYYETDPLYASLTNEPVGSYVENSKFLEAANVVNRIFRFGTTGIDRRSYVNQWAKDSMDASVIGMYAPFTDLSTGGLVSKVASIYRDMGGPGSGRLFASKATQDITSHVVDATYDTAMRGLVDEYGQEWYDQFIKRAVGDLTGEEAEIAAKRATVQYAVGDLGYDQLPGLGAKTRSQFYRGTVEDTEGAITPSEISRQRANVIYNNTDPKAYKATQQKLKEWFDNRVEDLSKGNFRETYYRKGVYVTNYKAAVESGMTHKEAQIWATRFALDATTNFSRTFMVGNRFIKSVPYLGAAINGTKSFWRLFELDPIGITNRFVFGLAIPYARVLSTCLSSEENRKAYANLREYEKDDALVFVWQGQVISIPAPEALAGFLAPFRHVIEKSADVQDHTWFELALSDTLGMLPIDMSGFVGLDKNELIADDSFTSRLGSGMEKMISSLMPPTVKGLYMMVTGRDPYTGQNINKDYWTITEDGEIIPMDSSKSALAKWLKEKFNPNNEPGGLTASGAEKVLQTIFGRSTMRVVNTATEILDGSFDPATAFDQAIGEYMKPLQAGEYNKAKSEWSSAINEAYKKKKKLETNDELKKNMQVMRDENYSEEKRADARRRYNEILDDYAEFVLNIANTMKAKYPEQYTDVRVAQVLSLLTLDQGAYYGDTAQAAEVQDQAYFEARSQAINTFLKMGFSADTPSNTLLGRGYYNKYGQYEFKVYTPYEIEALNNASFNTGERIEAEIRKAVKDSGIDTSKMWNRYFAAKTKAERKAWQNEWNAQVIPILYPIVEKYGLESVMKNKSTREQLKQYIFVDNQYKAEQYLRDVFGE